jgi:small-conductance mechanosensitive channel
MTDLLAGLPPFLSAPAWGDGSPTWFAVFGAAFWVTAGIALWLYIRRIKRKTPFQALGLRVVLVVLRIVGTALCALLAAGLLGVVDGAGLGRAFVATMNLKLADLGGTPVTVSGLIAMVAVVVFTFWGSSLLYQGIGRSLDERGIKTSGTVGVLLNLSRYVVILIGIAVALNTAGINLTALFTVGAVFAVTIGFALQNIAQNFVSGVILLVEGAIQPGDVLEVEGRIVRVTRMGIRSTVVRTIDDEDMILPNSTLAQGLVKNLTMMDTVMRVRAEVSVAYGSDLDHVIRVLEQAANTIPERLTDHDPVVLLLKFNDSGIDFDVSIWIREPSRAPRVRSALRLAIWRAFRDAKVKIPFPQVDVHFDPSGPPQPGLNAP